MSSGVDEIKSDSHGHVKLASARGRHKRTVFVAVAIATIVFVTAVSLYMINRSSPSAARVPDVVSETVLFPIYMPAKLPAGYTIDPTSYNSSQGVLLFVASNQKNQKIIFTEQPKPQEFDIPAFYQKSLTDPRSVPRSTYPSIIGKSDKDTWLLSVQADTTWIIVTTKIPKPEAALAVIARSLQRQ